MVEYAHGIVNKLEDLNDLEVAVLLCLVARENCLIDAEPEAIDQLVNELTTAVRGTFNLSCAVVDCSSGISLDDFCDAILIGDDQIAGEVSHETYDPSLNDRILFPGESESTINVQGPGLVTNSVDDRRVVNVVIANQFDHAPEIVQIQALELICSGRIHSRTAFHVAPKEFVFLPILSSNDQSLSSRLNKHLNDHMFISHYHDPHDGIENTDSDGQASISMSSTVRKHSIASGRSHSMHQSLAFHREDINAARKLCDDTTVSTDVNCYLHNITAFIRLNRAVSGGVSARASRHFDKLVRCLAPFHNLNYVPPSLVAIAAQKIYRHRIVVSSPKDDRSVLYGSNLKAVENILADATPESIIEEVISEVESPL